MLNILPVLFELCLNMFYKVSTLINFEQEGNHNLLKVQTETNL